MVKLGVRRAGVFSLQGPNLIPLSATHPDLRLQGYKPQSQSTSGRSSSRNSPILGFPSLLGYEFLVDPANFFLEKKLS